MSAGLLYVLVLDPVAMGVADEVASGWAGPVLLENDEMWGAMRPQVAVNGQGNAIAVWQHWDGSRWNIVASSYATGEGWGTPEFLEDGNGTARDPQIAFADHGNAIAAWVQQQGSRIRIFANRYVANVGWGSAVPLENHTGNAESVSLAVHGGNAVAAWHQSFEIWAILYKDGLGWSEPVNVSRSPGESGFVRVGMDAEGNALAVWRENGRIWASRYEPGLNWSAAGPLEMDPGGVFNEIRLAMSSSGSAIAVWSQYNGVAWGVWSLRYDPTEGWSFPLALAQPNVDWSIPDVAIGRTGEAVACWRQVDGDGEGVYCRGFSTSLGWGPPTLVSPDKSRISGQRVAVDADGNAIAIWSQLVESRWEMRAARLRDGAGWQMPRRIESNERNATNPEVAMEDGGNATAVWVQPSLTAQNVWSNRYTVDLVPPDLLITAPIANVSATPSLTIAGQTEPNATLTVNGELLPVNPDGTFAVTLMLADGHHTFEIEATDFDGNARRVLVRHTVDTSPPGISVQSPLAGATLESSDVVVVWAAQDATSGIERFEVQLDGQDPVDKRWAARSHVYSELGEGEHVVRVTAFDRAGNTASEVVEFNVSVGPEDGGVSIDPSLLAAILSTLIAAAGAVAIFQVWRKFRTPPRGQP